MLTGLQKRRGYREVLFNVNSGNFVTYAPGDNYAPLPIQQGDGGEVTTFGTGDINLETPTVTSLATLPDTSGLQTQQDFNIWAVSALESLGSGSAQLTGATFTDKIYVTTANDPDQNYRTQVASGGVAVRDVPNQKVSTLGPEHINIVDLINSTSFVAGPNYITAVDATVTAKEFIGDGSQLTGVGLPDFRTLPALS